MSTCRNCGKRITRMARQLATLCLACAAAFYGLGSGGVFGPGFDGPDEAVGYGDLFSLTTASGSNTTYLYATDAYPIAQETSIVSIRPANHSPWLVWPDAEPANGDDVES